MAGSDDGLALSSLGALPRPGSPGTPGGRALCRIATFINDLQWRHQGLPRTAIRSPPVRPLTEHPANKSSPSSRPARTTILACGTNLRVLLSAAPSMMSVADRAVAAARTLRRYDGFSIIDLASEACRATTCAYLHERWWRPCIDVHVVNIWLYFSSRLDRSGLMKVQSGLKIPIAVILASG